MNRLKELRKAKHLSQEELGSVLGVQGSPAERNAYEAVRFF